MALDVELAQIRDFLAQHPPFDDLPGAVLEALPQELSVEYFRRGTEVIGRGRANHHLYVLRSGAVDIRDADDVLVDRGEAGTCFGSITLVLGNPSTFSVTAIEDSLALVVPAEVFYRLGREHPAFAQYFDEQRASRMRGAVDAQQTSLSGGAVLKTRVRDLVRREPVTVRADVSIAGAARSMAEHGVSCLLVVEADELVGILTDRDLRTRVLAAGLDPSTAVADVMTAGPVTTGVDALAFEVLLEMVGRNIHHLPVLEQGRPVGVVTTTDLLRLERADPVVLVGDIRRQRDVEGLAVVSAQVAAVVEGLVAQDASAEDIGRVVTAIGDAFERRLLDLAQEQLGRPPVPYCWVVLGSRARQEQALAADQDHALVLDDRATPDDDAYFAAMARFVVDGLTACGYPPCTGEVMATNSRWRQPLAAWRRQFTDWFDAPTSEAVLNASIFLDLRPVHGEHALADQLVAHIRQRAPGARAFLGHLAKQAVANEPPIGFFRGFVLRRAGEHKDTLDIKRGGIHAVVEVARVLALTCGSSEVGTQARIAAAASAGLLGRESAADLRDAFEFISYVRLRHQAAAVRAGLPADNHLAPDELSSFEKRHLREAFGIVRSAQGVLAHTHQTHVIS